MMSRATVTTANEVAEDADALAYVGGISGTYLLVVEMNRAHVEPSKDEGDRKEFTAFSPSHPRGNTVLSCVLALRTPLRHEQRKENGYHVWSMDRGRREPDGAHGNLRSSSHTVIHSYRLCFTHMRAFALAAPILVPPSFEVQEALPPI